MLTWATLRMRLGALLVALIVGVTAATPALASLTACAPGQSIAVAITAHATSASAEHATAAEAEASIPDPGDPADSDRSSGAAGETCQDDHCQHTAYGGDAPLGVSAPFPSVQRAPAAPGRVAADDRQFGLKRPPRA